MVVEAKNCGGINERKQKRNVDINGQNRRRRVMDIKFSFRRKKKYRLECGEDHTGEANGSPHHHIAQHQQNDKSSKSLDDKPRRSIFSKIFSFSRRDHRKSDGSYVCKDKSKSVDCLASEQICENCNAITTSDDKQLRNKNNCLENGNQIHSNVTRTDMSISISSPNLATVKWPSFENFDETSGRGKYASFRRSRASMVFPILETVENDCGGLHSSNSERQLQQTPHPNANNAMYLKSCLPKNSDEKSCDKAENVCTRNTPKSEYLTRTNDGRSPHPRRRNPCYETFSSPNILVENDKRLIHTKIYQFTSVENVKDYECHGSGEDRTSKPAGDDDSCMTLDTFETKNGSEDDDFVFVTIGSPCAMQAKNKKLSRYISCPGNLETESYKAQLTSSFPLRGNPSKPYSSHRRPYSVHESVMSLDVLETNDVGIDVAMDDEEHDYTESPPDDDLSLPSRELPLGLAEALWDHSGKLKRELSFRAGETITVYFISKMKWWWGMIEERKGWFPSSHVRLRIDQKLSDSETGSANLFTKMSHSSFARHNAFSLLGMQAILCTESEVRSKCIQELLTSEQDYLKTLRDVIEGYLYRAKKKTEMFNTDDISVIFCNIERIYKFHKRFYRELKDEISKDNMFSSQIGKLFILHKVDFEIYSEYCNNHPKACARLFELQKEKKFKLFFESCRLLQKMISLSVDAFLLTPVQKICKYPLQLKELLKHTPKEHPDHDQLQVAVQVMKDVASSINEKKRKFENLNWIAEWQLNIEAWQGEDVLELSSEMIKTGSVESLFGGKREKIHLNLFDHQLIFCKVDSVKKPVKLVYENRINLDNARIDTVDDPTGESGSMLIRVTDFGENVTYWISTKDSEELEQWRIAFNKERHAAASELLNGFTIPLAMRRAAMQSAKAKKQAELKKGSRRRKSVTDPFQGFGSNVIRRSLRLRRTQSLREKKQIKSP